MNFPEGITIPTLPTDILGGLLIVAGIAKSIYDDVTSDGTEGYSWLLQGSKKLDPGRLMASASQTDNMTMRRDETRALLQARIAECQRQLQLLLHLQRTTQSLRDLVDAAHAARRRGGFKSRTPQTQSSNTRTH